MESPESVRKQGGYFITEENLQSLVEVRDYIDAVCDISDAPPGVSTTVNVSHVQSLLGAVRKKIDTAIEHAQFTTI